MHRLRLIRPLLCALLLAPAPLIAASGFPAAAREADDPHPDARDASPAVLANELLEVLRSAGKVDANVALGAVELRSGNAASALAAFKAGAEAHDPVALWAVARMSLAGIGTEIDFEAAERAMETLGGILRRGDDLGPVLGAKIHALEQALAPAPAAAPRPAVTETALPPPETSVPEAVPAQNAAPPRGAVPASTTQAQEPPAAGEDVRTGEAPHGTMPSAEQMPEPAFEPASSQPPVAAPAPQDSPGDPGPAAAEESPAPAPPAADTTAATVPLPRAKPKAPPPPAAGAPTAERPDNRPSGNPRLIPIEQSTPDRAELEAAARRLRAAPAAPVLDARIAAPHPGERGFRVFLAEAGAPMALRDLYDRLAAKLPQMQGTRADIRAATGPAGRMFYTLHVADISDPGVADAICAAARIAATPEARVRDDCGTEATPTATAFPNVPTFSGDFATQAPRQKRPVSLAQIAGAMTEDAGREILLQMSRFLGPYLAGRELKLLPGGGGPMDPPYRLVVVGFSSDAEAFEFCASLNAQGRYCVLVRP